MNLKLNGFELTKKITILAVVICMPVVFLLQAAYSQQSSKKNPYEGNDKAIKEGAAIFKKNCEACHGVGGKGRICPNLTDKEWKYGNSDADLLQSISKGRPGGMPNWENFLGKDMIWKVITYLRSVE